MEERDFRGAREETANVWRVGGQDCKRGTGETTSCYVGTGGPEKKKDNQQETNKTASEQNHYPGDINDLGGMRDRTEG